MSLFESTLLNFCKPQSKLDLPTLRQGSRERMYVCIYIYTYICIHSWWATCRVIVNTNFMFTPFFQYERAMCSGEIALKMCVLYVWLCMCMLLTLCRQLLNLDVLITCQGSIRERTQRNIKNQPLCICIYIPAYLFISVKNSKFCS